MARRTSQNKRERRDRRRTRYAVGTSQDERNAPTESWQVQSVAGYDTMPIKWKIASLRAARARKSKQTADQIRRLMASPPRPSTKDFVDKMNRRLASIKENVARKKKVSFKTK